MNNPLAQKLWPACLSSLQLDRFALGELDAALASQVSAHLRGCAECAAALSQLEAREPLPPLRVVPLRPRLRLGRAAAAVAGLAAAASVALALLPARPAVRSKGSGFALSMYVQHGAEVRRAAPGDAVEAGDAVRFAVSAPAAGYLAVLSLDPQGRASVYFPLDGYAARVAAGVDLALPIGTRLDSSRGEERIVGLFCTEPLALEPLRAALERGTLSAPAGCQVTRWSFLKR